MTVSMEVRERMLTAWRPRVLKAGRRLIGRAKEWMELDDLVSVGLLALDKAITQFDPARGTQFEHFANSRIRFGMLKEIERVRCPEVSVSNYVNDDEGRAEHIDNQADFRACEGNAGSASGKQVSETGMAERSVNKQFWKEAFEDCLTGRETRVVRSIIWERMTEYEVGQELGISQQWVSDIYRQALERLKEYLTAHGLDAHTTLSVR